MIDLSILLFNITLLRALGVLIQALVVLHLARSLEIYEFGIFATSFATLGVARYLGALGSDHVVLRRVAGFHKGILSKSAKAEINASLFITAVGCIIIGTSIHLILTISGYSNIFTVEEYFILILALPAFAIQGTFIAQIRSIGQNIAAQAPEALGLHILMALFIGIMSVSELLNRTSALAGLCFSGWGVTLFYIILRRKFGLKGLTIPNRTVMFEVLKGCHSSFGANLLTITAAKSPVFIALYLFGPAGSAVMDIAMRLGNVTSLVTASAGASFSPVFARLSATPNGKSLNHVLLKGSLLVSIPAIIWIFILIMFSNLAIEEYLPQDYSTAASATIIIAIASFINAATGLATNVLIMSNRAKIVAYMSLGQIVTLILTSVLLGPLVGVVGVAAGIVAGTLIRDGGAFYYYFYYSRNV